jgi:hypothetical protein
MWVVMNFGQSSTSQNLADGTAAYYLCGPQSWWHRFKICAKIFETLLKWTINSFIRHSFSGIPAAKKTNFVIRLLSSRPMGYYSLERHIKVPNVSTWPYFYCKFSLFTHKQMIALWKILGSIRKLYKNSLIDTRTSAINTPLYSAMRNTQLNCLLACPPRYVALFI